MIYYVVAALGLLAAVFYGLWQRALREQAQKDAGTFKASWLDAVNQCGAQALRYERLVSDLKHQLEQMEDFLNANPDPERTRARFAELFPRPSPPAVAPAAVPPGPAPDAGSGAGG